MILSDVGTALQKITQVLTYIKSNITNYYDDTSLSDVTKLTRVEPLTIISKDLINLEYMPDVANSLLSIFAGYYLQAVAMLTRVNDIEVVKILDRLNPNRDGSGLLLSTESRQDLVKRNLVLESYKHKLPGTGTIALEAMGDQPVTTDDVNSISNLSIGKLINVEILYSKGDSEDQSMFNTNMPKSKDDLTNDKTKARKVIIPIAIRLLASVIPNATITNLLALKGQDHSLMERYHAWRSGRISFIKDLIFCQDLIDEYKRTMIGDDSGTMLEILRRVNNAKKFGLLTKNPSLVAASNIFVISEEVARELESKLGGKLSSTRTRNKAFENTYAMIIAVVDREWERVTFYVRGIDQGTSVSIKEIRAVSKNKNGPDIGDLLKAMSQGIAPAF